MSDADTLRVLNRTVERLNEAEAALFAASWERMVVIATLLRCRDDEAGFNYLGHEGSDGVVKALTAAATRTRAVAQGVG